MSKSAQVKSSLAMAPDKIYLSVEATWKYVAKNSGEGGNFSAKADQISPWYYDEEKVFFFQNISQALPHFIIRGW